ncbi:MAG: hypothetical protein ACLQEQ_08240 [Nitrososphaerales archaeon]
MDLDSVRFFTVELRNGHVMSTPKYEPAQEFVGSLIHEVSLKGPEFAWIQFVFRNLDYHPQLVSLKAELSYYKKYADSPETKTDGEGRDYTAERKEKSTEWYRSIQEKVKKIDAVKSQPTISMTIRGMWVGDVDTLAGVSAFSNCSDELDRLAVVPLCDPRMLVWLVGRRVLADPAEYLWHYGTKARKASPELMLTTDELPYYVQLPAGKKSVATLKGVLDFGASSTARKETVEEEGIPIFREDEGQETAGSGESLKVVSIRELAELDDPLKEEEAAELRHLASNVTRSFEIVYDRRLKKPATLLLSSRTGPDLLRFEEQLNAVYSRMDYAEEDRIPPYVRELGREIADSLPPFVKAEPSPHT